MRKYKGWLSLVLIVVAIIAAGVAAAVDTPSPWTSSGAPTLTETATLPANIMPASNNLDCNKITTRLAGTMTTTNDCVVPTALGMVGNNFIFTGTSEAIPVVPPSGYYGLRPISNQGMFYTFSSSPVVGLSLHFYTSIGDKLKPLPDFVNGRWQYTLTKGPDFSLRDPSGKLLAINPFSMAFSKNGSWMVADIPFQGFVRINLATFDMVPFAPSRNQGNDYRTLEDQVAISNDGRYAAIKAADTSSALLVYDIASCSGAVLPVSVSKPVCQPRNYTPVISKVLPTLRFILQPRFINSTQLSFTAVYDFVNGGNLQAKQYVLTAPGENYFGVEYLGMGDSYASGQGAFNYLAGTDTTNNTCHLSSLSYPVLIASQLFESGRSVACSGAKMQDITNSSGSYDGQVEDLIIKDDRKNRNEIFASYLPGYFAQNDFVDKYRPQAITLSIGGNDVGFADIVKQCVIPKLYATTCFPTYEDQKELADRITSVGERLASTYRAVSAQGRRVYAIGYPQIVVENGNCAANVHLDAQEITMFIGLTNLLNSTIKNAAEKAGAQYVDVSNAFAGSRMCETKSSEVAVNGFTAGNDDGFKQLKFIGAESYHPNALGHELLKRAILGQTNNLKQLAAPAAPVAPAPQPIFPLPSAPKSDRPTLLSLSSGTLLPDILTPAKAIAIKVTAETALLKSSSAFTLKMDAGGAVLGTASTDSAGNLTGSVTLPATLTCGYHTARLSGYNILGQAIDITKVVYVDTGNDTCADADADACGLVPASGKDVDEDSIDDACDPLISAPPAKANYTVFLTGLSIHAVRKQ